MKLAALMMTAALTAAAAFGGENTEVTACLENTGNHATVVLAKAVASKMFAAIGVDVHWHRGLQGCPSQGIQISLGRETPVALKPGALAYALPYEGSHIVVFYDRIVDQPRSAQSAYVLAHVFVHEITHILQGIDRHSAEGVMKANWNSLDYGHMACKPLAFTKHDVELIQAGLERRSQRALLAMSSAVAPH